MPDQYQRSVLQVGCEAFGLTELLELVKPEGSTLAWRLFPMGEGTELVSKDSALDVLELERRVDSSVTGLEIGWDELLTLSQSLEQILWASFVACRNKEGFTGLDSQFADAWKYLDRALPEFYASVEIALQMVDSSFWLIYVKDDGLRERLRERFQADEAPAPGQQT